MSHSDTIKKILIAVGATLLVAFQTPDEYLQTIDLKDLCIVYSQNHQGYWIARVKDPNGYYHLVTVGSRIGKNHGMITKIINDTVDVIELLQDESTGDYFERTLTLEVGCPMNPTCANSPSDGSHIVWLIGKRGEKRGNGFTRVHLGLSVGDRRAWRWVYGAGRGIEPATSEEAKELKEEYGDADLSRFLYGKCPTPR